MCGFKVTEVGAGVANTLVLDEEEQTADSTPGIEGADTGAANDPLYRMDGLDGADPTHTFSSELSSQGVAIFNYSMQDRMSGDGGSANKAGYINFSPLSAEDVDQAQKREKEANDWLHLTLEQYEAARRLAELDAQIAALEKKIGDLDRQINAFDRAFGLADDADINDSTLNALAKREQLRQAIQDAGLDPNAYFKADGSFDQEKWLRDQEENRLRMRDAQRQRDQYVDQLIRAQRDRETLLRNNPELRDNIKGAASGNPEASSVIRARASSDVGFRDVGTVVLNNPDGLSRDEQARAVAQTGLVAADTTAAVLDATSSEDVFDNFAALGVSTELPPAAPVVQNARLPETLPELLAPVNAALPADMQIPAPDIKLYDLIPEGLLTSAYSPSSARATGSFAAELGMDDATGGIKPISGTFARAMNGEIPAAAVASADATLAAAVADQERFVAYSSGTSAAGGMKV